MNKSIHDHATRVTLLSKDFNIKQLGQCSLLLFSELNNNEIFDINNLKNSYAIGGVYIYSTTELMAAVLLPIKNNKKYVISQFFMPSGVIEKRK